MNKTNTKGFTLIELLVVIAIIGILSTIAMTSLNGARKKANDAAFKSAVASIQAAAVICCDNGGTLQTAVADAGTAVCSDSTLGNYPKGIGAVSIATGKNCSSGDFQVDVAIPTSFGGTVPAGHCDATHCWYTAS